MKVTIESIKPTETFASGFSKREFIGIDNASPEYPTPIKFEVVKDKCSELDSFSIGQEVNVEFNIRGNRWVNPKGEEVIFNSFSVWKILSTEQAPNPTGTPQAESTPDWLNTDGETQDMPF